MKKTDFFASAEDFSSEFIKLIESNEPSLLETHGVSIVFGDYELYFFCDDDAENANDALISLARNRMDLFKPALEYSSFRNLILTVHELSRWLNQRGINVG